MLSSLPGFLVTLVVAVRAYSVPSWSVNDVSGIWRLTTTTTQVTQTQKQQQNVVLKLNQDHTFVEFDNGSESDRLMEGVWDYRSSDNVLLLAMADDNLLLKGKLEAHESTALTSEEGQTPASSQDDNNNEMETAAIEVHLFVKGPVSRGTFLYPQKHPSYFELYQSQTTGTFSLRQVFGTLLVRAKRKKQLTALPQVGEFHGEHFWLTVLPVQSKIPYDTKQPDNVQDLMRQEAVDLRVYPIDFFQNNTFCAVGSNKMLRGRFGISSKGELWFQVSLFGSGRSVSGSVYSEGQGLSHEDRRSYLGTIHNDTENGCLRVEGSVLVGSDLGSDARPEPVATFILTERTAVDEDENVEDDAFPEGAFE